jgi:hypothetical protein
MKTQNFWHLALGILSTTAMLSVGTAAMAEPLAEPYEAPPVKQPEAPSTKQYEASPSEQYDGSQPARFGSSYVGAGISGGLLKSGLRGGERTFGGNAVVRLTSPELLPVPVSLRGQLLFANTNSAIVPTLTYDYPVTDKVNVYAGFGYSFINKKGQTSPIGNRNAFVLNLGVESEISESVVGYVDAKYGVNGYVGDKSSLAISGGVGVKF